MTGTSEATRLLAFAALLGACAHAAPANAPAAGDAPGDLSDAPRTLVAVRMDGVEVDWSAPWGTGKTWTGTQTGTVVEGHKILLGGRWLRTQRHIEVQKLGSSPRVPARVLLYDDDAGLGLITVDDPGFWVGLRPVAFSSPVGDGAAVKVLHVAADASQAETSGGNVHGFAIQSHVNLLQMKLSLADAERVANSDVVSVGGKLSGLVMSNGGGDVWAVAAPTVQDFLSEASRTPYRGYPALALRWQSLNNPALREELGLDPDLGGVRVDTVWPVGSASGVLEPGDVLLSIGGTKIGSDGMYAHPWAGRVFLSALLSDGHHAGDALDVSIIRHGERKTVSMLLKRARDGDDLIPDVESTEGRAYAIEGGLVFEHLTRQYLRTLGASWETSAPPHLLELYELSRLAPSAERPRVVILTRVLPAPSTLGYEHLRNLVVEQVNGTPVRTLEDVVAAFEHPAGAFHVITFAPGEGIRRIVLDVQEAKAADARIRESYHLAADGTGPRPAP